MMTHNEMIEVIQAHRDGKALEWRRKGEGCASWKACDCGVSWDFWAFDYRVKPEPREWWVVSFRDGSCVGYPNKADAEGTQRPVTLVREVLP